jgi:hypothetical protein
VIRTRMLVSLMAGRFSHPPPRSVYYPAGDDGEAIEGGGRRPREAVGSSRLLAIPLPRPIFPRISARQLARTRNRVVVLSMPAALT